MFTLEIDGFVARITIDRPAARNAIAPDQWALLGQAARDAAAGGARAVLLRSAVDGVFSAGADLKQLVTLLDDPAGRAPFRAAMAAAFAAIRAIPVPTIAVIDGGCFGAGVALALACDIRIAGARARFAIPPAKFGIVYPLEDVNALVDRVGTAQAKLLLATADEIDATEAARIGLVERVVTDAGVEAEAMALRIAANAPSSVRLLKRMADDFYSFIEESEDGRLSAADRAFENSFGSADFAEGVAAMRAKRTPVFGR